MCMMSNTNVCTRKHNHKYIHTHIKCKHQNIYIYIYTHTLSLSHSLTLTHTHTHTHIHAQTKTGKTHRATMHQSASRPQASSYPKSGPRSKKRTTASSVNPEKKLNPSSLKTSPGCSRNREKCSRPDSRTGWKSLPGIVKPGSGKLWRG